MPLLDRDGVRIHYEVHGKGPVVLLSHGYSATSQMWRGQIAALSKDHTLVTWDMRGHGRSDYPEDQDLYSEAHTVEDMAAILDAHGIHVEVVTSRRPGYVVYEDRHQIAAVPFADTRA